MDRVPTKLRLAGIWTLVALFALAGFSTAARALSLIAAGDLDWRALVQSLATLGFVSLTWRAVREAIRILRSDRPQSPA